MEMVIGGLIAFVVEAVLIALVLGWKPIRHERLRHDVALRERITRAADRWHLRPPRLAG